LAQFKVEVFMENQNYEQKRLEETRTKIKIMSELLKGNHNSLKELEELVPNIENSLKKVESELKALLIKEKTLLETVSISRVKYSKAQIFSSNNQRCNVLSFLMKLKSEGRINGIFGRLVTYFIKI
jgi:chromosome segregation ATPase